MGVAGGFPGRAVPQQPSDLTWIQQAWADPKLMSSWHIKPKPLSLAQSSETVCVGNKLTVTTEASF